MKFQNPSFKMFLNGRAETDMLPNFSKLGDTKTFFRIVQDVPNLVFQLHWCKKQTSDLKNTFLYLPFSYIIII